MTIDKNELKVREYEIYQGYYCGICKSIARRYGQIPRFTLSYDAVFLALILAGLEAENELIEQEHCIVHHIRKKPVIYGNKAVDYAADVMVILAYHKFLDDWKDDRSVSAFAGKSALSFAYRKLHKLHPGVCGGIEASLKTLSALELQKSGSLDRTCEAFAQTMEILFTGFGIEGAAGRILGQLGKSLGRWIYAVDALDDYEKDQAEGSYNPLIYRKNNLEGMEDLLYNYLADITKSYDLLNLKKNRGIIENIIFMGIRQRTDQILRERTDIHEQSI